MQRSIPKSPPQKYLPARLRALRCALAGLVHLLHSEPHARIHLLATLLVLATALILRLRPAEWCWIILALAAVWTAEALNTALERICDALHPRHHPLIGQAKDLAAAAVLITALAAAILAALILLPHLL